MPEVSVVSAAGRVLLLDSYINRPELPTTPLDKRRTPIALAAEIGKGLFSIMDNLPHPDVLLGSIVSLGAANNQQRDIIQYTQHLKPKVYYPGHLTDVAQAGSALYHKLSWRDTAYNMGFPQSEWPEFRLQIDPNDFLVPQVFNPSDERWSKSRKAEDQVRSQCR
ncbi:MAG TPA: hypothetical protein VII08_02090 [Myxococcales bacterium]